MANSFAPAGVELKHLKNKLNNSTFSAVFSYSAPTRLASLNNAAATEQRINEVLQKVVNEAHQVSSFMQSSQGRSLLETVDGFINLVEQSGTESPR